MSCIAAILHVDGAPVDLRQLRSLLDVPPYRTPHAWHLLAEGPVGVAWAPLPGAALVAAAQPFVLDRAGVRSWAVLDGRLDDRASVVAALRDATGLDLMRAPDVELVLRAYVAWGASCGARLLGDFAACIWDGDRRALVGLRDHFGVKPLYYARSGQTLVLGNVLRGVRAATGAGTALRSDAVADLLLCGGVQDESATMFVGVSRVPPAHTLTCASGSGTTSIERYWSLEPGRETRYRRPQEYVEHFWDVLMKAVRDRLGAGGTGILMSGGLDSASLAAAAAVHGRGHAGGPLRAYTAVYDRLMPDEERHYSALVAQALGIGIEHLPVDDYRLFERWDGDALPPEPTLEPLSAIMSDLLDRAAHHAPVLLTGDGGDPALIPATVVRHFGRRAVQSIAADGWNCWRRGLRPPLGIKTAVRAWVRPPQQDVPPWLTDTLLRAVDVRERLERYEASIRPSGEALRADAWTQLVSPWWASTFEAQDPGATGRAVETRHPFFDRRVIACALGLPSMPWCIDKTVLREATAGVLPDVIRRRPKTPLAGDPIEVRPRGTVADAVRLFEAVPAMTAVVDTARFRRAVSDAALMLGRAPGSLAAICLARWLERDGRRNGAA